MHLLKTCIAPWWWRPEEIHTRKKCNAPYPNYSHTSKSFNIVIGKYSRSNIVLLQYEYIILHYKYCPICIYCSCTQYCLALAFIFWPNNWIDQWLVVVFVVLSVLMVNHWLILLVWLFIRSFIAAPSTSDKVGLRIFLQLISF